MSALNESKLPLVFKGALVLFQAKTNKDLVRTTSDIDCDWVVSPPTNKELETKLNEAIKEKLPHISFKQYRKYSIGKTSAGFEVLENGEPLTTMDVSIKPATSSQMYFVGECCFCGYDLMNIVSDKISVLSSNKIPRRIKDLLDIYSVCVGDDIYKSSILQQLKAKERELGDFSFFFNNKNDLEHAYNKYKTLVTKPKFDDVYSVVLLFVLGFIDENKTVWSYENLRWLP